MMSTKYNNLNQLRKQKEVLKSEVQDLEKLISFDNAKQSLGAFTNGYSDKFLKETKNEEGKIAVSLKTDAIIKEVATEVKDRMIGKNAMLGIASAASKNGLLEEGLKLGVTALIGNYARKNMKNSNWKKRIIGLALVYVAPIVIRYGLKKVEEYQKNKSVSSFEQLI
jgi:hypothetical protein